MESLYIVMPAYNEEGNIEHTVKAWYQKLPEDQNSRLAVADSGSTDRTHEILINLRRQYPRIEILSDTDRFHGPKLMALYDHAIRQGADYIFQTDSDGQTDPDEFDRFWKLRRKYDVILGNRVHRGDGLSRKFVEKTVCLLLFLFFSVRVPDANAPFRLMKSSVAEKYIGRLPKDYALPNIMFTAYFVHNREKTAFVPVSFSCRKHGVNSINMLKIMKIGVHAVRDFWRFRKEL